MNTLADALPDEIKRINEIVIPAYEALVPENPIVALPLAVIRSQVDAATRILASGDVIAMIQAYKELKEIEC